MEHSKCGWLDVSAEFRKDNVVIKCMSCGIQAEIPELDYFKMWGYPKGKEKLGTSEWLHSMEGKVGREYMTEKIRIEFVDVEKGITLGITRLPYGAVTKLSIGDRLEFKETGSIFGMYEIQSFAVNQGAPDGAIHLKPVTAKAKIKLQEINEGYLDSLIPF